MDTETIILIQINEREKRCGREDLPYRSVLLSVNTNTWLLLARGSRLDTITHTAQSLLCAVLSAPSQGCAGLTHSLSPSLGAPLTFRLR